MIENVKPSMSKRLLSILIDFVIYFVLMFILSNFVFGPIIINSDNYKNNYSIYEEKLINSNLVVKDENKNIVFVYQVGKLETVDDFNKYDNILIQFYTNFNSEKSEENVNAYNEAKKDYKSIFNYDETTKVATLKENIFDTSSQNYKTNMVNVSNYFYYSYSNALNFMKNNDKDFANSYNALIFNLNMKKYLSIGIAALIPFLILPLFLHGQSLGKKVMGLQIRKYETDLGNVNMSTILLRSIWIIVIDIMGSYLLYCIPAVISIIMLVANKDSMTLHDMICKTIVVDKKLLEENNVSYNNVDSSNVIEAEVVEKNEEK